MLFQAMVNAKNAGKLSSSSHKKWNFSQHLYAQFVNKQNTHYLVIKNASNILVAEHLIPRAKNLGNITWSKDAQHLTFTENNRNLWLYNLQENSVTLIEHNPQSEASIKFDAKWSPNGEWMQYLSSKNVHFPAKVYSLKRKRAYYVPIAADNITDIAWHNIHNELVIKTDQATKITPHLSLFSIALTLKANTQIVKAN